MGDLLEDIFGISDLEPYLMSSVATLGLDSLLSLEVQERLMCELSVETSVNQVHNDMTVAELRREIMDSLRLPDGGNNCPSRKRTSTDPSHQLVLLQEGSTGRSPLILFHDESGSIAEYRKIGQVPFPLYGISSHFSAEDGKCDSSLRYMAKRYSSIITSQFSENAAVILGGENVLSPCTYSIDVMFMNI